MDKPLPKEKKEYNFFDDYDALTGVVSATECTGLMYRPAENDDEAESYNEICSVYAVANSGEEKLKENG